MGKFRIPSIIRTFLCGAYGITLLAWTALVIYQQEQAFEWVMSVLLQSPIPLPVPPEEIATIATEDGALLLMGLVSGVCVLIALVNLRAALQPSRTPDMSLDGKAKIILQENPPRVGRPLQGRVRLLKDVNPGEMFQIELSCSHGESQVFVEKQDVRVIRDSQGGTVSFRFDIPATAPSFEPWRLAIYPSKSLTASPSIFELKLEPTPPERFDSAQTTESREQKETFDAIARALGRSLLPEQRARLRELSKEHLALARTVVKFTTTMRKYAGVIFLVILGILAIGVIDWLFNR